jgi:uncharacterized paraquat-inducible protein A
MATCPRCRGHLTDGHRCPRRRGLIAAEIIASGLAGAVVGLLLFAVFIPRDDMDAIGIVGGAAVGIGINRIIRSY